VKYVYDVAHWDQRFFSAIAEALDHATYSAPHSLVYLGRDSQVVDLSILEEGIQEACVPDHPAADDFLVP
jgi:hypothetical protein